MNGQLAHTLENAILFRGWSREIAADELNVSMRKLRRWLNGDKLPQNPKDIRALRRTFGFRELELERLMGITIGSLKRPRATSFSKHLKSDGTWLGLAKKLHHIEDVEFDLVGSSKVKKGDKILGEDKEWSKVYEQCGETGSVILGPDGDINAHWLFAPVTQEVVASGLRGENIDGSFSIASLKPFSVPADYDVYFVSLFLREKFQNVATNRECTLAIQDKLLQLAVEGYFVRRIFGNMSSQLMVTLADSLGFEFVCDHAVHEMNGEGGKVIPTKIFSADLRESKSDRILEHTPRLLDLYREWREGGA